MLIDATTLLHGEHADTYIDLGLDVDLPVETIRRMATTADVWTPVITAANGINLHLGAPNAWPAATSDASCASCTPRCAMPGCQSAVRQHRHPPHRLVRPATTAAPTSTTSHPSATPTTTASTEATSTVTIDTQRTLTITHPDGTTMTTGPPKRGAG